MDVCRERFQRLDRSVNVGRFRIVVVLDSADRSHVFQTVFYRLEILHCSANLLSLTAHECPHTDGSHSVFDIMSALQRDLGSQHDFVLLLSHPETAICRREDRHPAELLSFC